MKKAAITSRVMPSFLRFGSAQLAAKRQGVAGLTHLARHALDVLSRMERHDDASVKYLQRLRQPVPKALRRDCFFVALDPPSCAGQVGEVLGGQEVLRCLLQRLVQRTAALVAGMAVGFAHGVMNTDNLSLLGTTVDLNVFGFLSKYDPSWAPNHIDDTARYAFGAQPEIAKWNLQRLSDALTGTPFLADREPDAMKWSAPGEWLDASIAAQEVDNFDQHFERCFVARMEVRLGLPATGLPCAAGVSGGCVVKHWVQWLERTGADYPRASRGLSDVLEADAERASNAAERLAEHAGANSTTGLVEILQELRQLQDQLQLVPAIRAAVPKLSLRSHVLAEAAKLVEIQRPGSKARQFLKLLQRLLEEPFQEVEAVVEVDDPKGFWQKTDLHAEEPEDEDLQLGARLVSVLGHQ